jgi:hypothetical protein
LRAFVWAMDPIRNRTAERARRGGRGVAPPGPPPRRRRRRFPMGSGRVPTEFRPPRTRPRQEPEFRDADVAPPGTRRNSRGTEWGLDRNRDPSGSSRMGTEWGLGPFTIEQTTEDVTAIHRLAASRLRGRRIPRHRRPARATERRSAQETGATVTDASRTSDQDGPEPGHLMRRHARSEREAGGALGRRANATKTPATDAAIREGSPGPDGRRRARPAA